MKLERVVVGTDFSDASVEAAQWAARRFAPRAEIVLVHAVTVPEPPVFLRGRFPQSGTLIATARAGAEARLRELGASLGAERIWLETRVGRPWKELADVAAAYEADVVVVGRHVERPGVWSRLGSTAQMLVRSTKVPVLLATGPRDTRLRHVLAALDDSDAAPSAAAWARHFATRDQARVTALHVVSAAVLDSILALAEGATGWDDGGGDTREAIRRGADRWLDALVGDGAPRERATSEVAFGEAGQEILGAAERHDSDLIVMGSHGGGAMRRLFVGSVAAEVLRGATCPVLVVKAPEEDPID